MMTPTFSIIIPHKDIPELLQRCLDSIPVRNDVEVIVVDDNSSPQKVDFGHFPKWKGKHFEYHLTKEGKGPGFARNVGLDHARGRWIVFADADDFFAEDFNVLLDEMKDAEEDIVFFDYINVLSDDITVLMDERTYYRKLISDYLAGGNSEVRLRATFPVPWSKIVKKQIIEENNIRFSETKWGNDEYFSARVSFFAKNVKVNCMVGYVVTSRRGSITCNFCATPKEYGVRLNDILKCDDLFEDRYGPHVRSKGWLWYVYRIKGFRRLAWFGIANIHHPRVFLRTVSFLYEANGRNLKKGIRNLLKN